MKDRITETAGETHYLIRYPEEISDDLEKEKQIIRANLESDNSAWFTVFDGDRAVGNCSIRCQCSLLKLKHRCDFAIAIEQDYCGCGLGFLLTSKAMEQAKKMGFEQMELGVYADNERAIAFYQKMGFEAFGRTPRAFRHKDGTYSDEISMVRFL